MDGNAEGPRRVQPRHFHASSISHAASSSSSSAAAAASAALPSLPSIDLMHEDAWGCVFGFSDMKELCCIAQVSKIWQAATIKMPSIAATVRYTYSVSSDVVAQMLTCPLRKHIGHFDATDDALTVCFNPLEARSILMSGIQSLRVPITYKSPTTKFPVHEKLQHLSLLMHKDSATVAHFNALISEFAQHAPQLISLRFITWTHSIAGLDFSPLGKLPSLSTFGINVEEECEVLGFPDSMHWHFTTRQWDDLASIPSLTHLSVDDLSPESVAQLVAARPFPLLERISFLTVSMRPDAWTAFLSMPKLRELHGLLELLNGPSRLAELSKLTHVELTVSFSVEIDDQEEEEEKVMQSLAACHNITFLKLKAMRITRACSRTLTHLPGLKSLQLDKCRVPSLDFLRSCPSTLEHLSFAYCYPPLDLHEAHHLFPLRALVSLDISGVFDTKQWTARDRLTRATFTAPSSIFHSLRSFVGCTWSD